MMCNAQCYMSRSPRHLSHSMTISFTTKHEILKDFSVVLRYITKLPL